MPMPKRKPNYNGSRTMQELLAAVCEYYGDPVDDRKQEDHTLVPVTVNESCTECKQNMNKRDRHRIKYILTL